MTISSSENLVTKCHFRQEGGIHCFNGYLYTFSGSPAIVGDDLVQCPACEGKSVILTDRGKELMMVLETFARPMLRDLVDELFEERERL